MCSSKLALYFYSWAWNIWLWVLIYITNHNHIHLHNVSCSQDVSAALYYVLYTYMYCIVTCSYLSWVEIKGTVRWYCLSKWSYLSSLCNLYKQFIGRSCDYHFVHLFGKSSSLLSTSEEISRYRCLKMVASY